MAFKKPQINKVVEDMKNLTTYIRTIKKFGKTTLFRDVILEKYNDPERGLLVGVGAELGYQLLDNLNFTHAETWKDLLDIKDWLIKQKGKEHNVEIVAFDVAEEFITLLEKEAIRLSNIENPKKQCKSINGAFGGYGAGGQKVVEMGKDYFLELKKAGIGVWVIGHTKYKNVKQKGDIEDGYQSLSSTLQSNYESIFADIFDCVLTGYIDRDLEEETVEVAGQEKTIRKAHGAERRLYFRGTDFIDAGCRFKDGAVPEYMVFDKPNMAKDFIETLENGMKLSKSDAVFAKKEVKNVVEEHIIEKQEEIVNNEREIVTDNLEFDEEIEEPVVEEYDSKDLLELIKPLFKLATKDDKVKVKEVLTKYGEKALNSNTNIEALKEILDLLQ